MRGRSCPPGYAMPSPGGWWALLEPIDRMRRWQGRVLDALGLGPIETPSRVVHSQPGVTLKVYGTAGDNGPVVLLVPAPIKCAYIWAWSPGPVSCSNASAEGPGST